jgi:hypothetical protein
MLAAKASLAAEVMILASKVDSDRSLDRAVRAEAQEIQALAASNPDRAESRLLDLAERTAPSLARVAPAADLCRCLPLETFWARHLDPDVRAFFPDWKDYAQHLTTGDPELLLRRELAAKDPLFSAKHSWLVQCADIRGLDSNALKRVLALRGDPPYVVFEFALPELLATAVTIRKPRAVDAIPAHLVEWDPNGLPTGLAEFIDSEIPVAAVSRVRWQS